MTEKTPRICVVVVIVFSITLLNINAKLIMMNMFPILDQRNTTTINKTAWLK